MDNEENVLHQQTKILTPEEIFALDKQNTRLVPEHKANLLEIYAKKHWDLFYKRNETRFFKDRHWTVREFNELLNQNPVFNTLESEKKVLLEIGCGVGNFIYPLIEENMNFFFMACDISPRAIELLKSHSLYNENKIKAFQADFTDAENVFKNIDENSIDFVTMIFVLSAIHPDKFLKVVTNIYKVLKPNGMVLFRDYGLYDMAQLRFKAGNKIAENFYMRQDGTRSYYFSTDVLTNIFTEVGFSVESNTYIHRRTVNKKENIDVPRIFIQAKFVKITKVEKNQIEKL